MNKQHSHWPLASDNYTGYWMDYHLNKNKPTPKFLHKLLFKKGIRRVMSNSFYYGKISRPSPHLQLKNSQRKMRSWKNKTKCYRLNSNGWKNNFASANKRNLALLVKKPIQINSHFLFSTKLKSQRMKK